MSMPAAKQNDIVQAVDIHIVMVPSPGGPVPTPLPHPFVGQLNSGLATSVKVEGMPAAMVDSVAKAVPAHIPTPPGTSFQKPPKNEGKVFMGSATVLIEGKPAARMGDQCMTCNDPSDLPVGTIISTTATVLIGGPPSKAGSKAKGSQASQSSGSAGEAAEGKTEEKKAEEDVTFEVKRPDGKGLEGAAYELVLPDGEKKTGKIGADGKVEEKKLPPGIASLRLEGLHNARWAGEVGVADEAMEMVVEAVQLPEGTSVSFEVYREFEEAKGESVATVSGKVSGGLARAQWTYSYEERDEGSRPRFVFHATSGEHRAISPPVTMGGTLSAKLETTEGKPLASWPVEVVGCDGAKSSTRTAPDGKLEVRGVAFGKARLRLRDGAVVRSEG